jgi:hypothetical protein
MDVNALKRAQELSAKKSAAACVPDELLRRGNLIEGHAVLLHGLQVFALDKVDVPNVDAQAAGAVKSLVLDEGRDGVGCLGVHFAGLVHIGQVDVDLERKEALGAEESKRVRSTH